MDKPYFLWDYNITDKDVYAILRGNNEMERLWLIARILNHARFEDVWKYVTLGELVNAFPKLRLRPSIKQAWKNALTVWGYLV